MHKSDSCRWVSKCSGFAAVLLMATFFSGSAIAQGTDKDEQPMVFKAVTRRVLLDVVVKDKKGNVVTNLKEDDFTIEEDGVVQPIRSFDPPAAHEMPVKDKVVVQSTEDLKKIGPAPVSVLVMDELNTTFEDLAYSRDQLYKYLNAQPAILRQPTTLLVVTNTKFQVLVDYTQDREKIREALKKHMPEFPWKAAKGGAANTNAAFERMALSLNSLHQVTDASRGTPGRKSVIWVGKGFPAVNLLNLDTDTAQLMKDAVKRLTNELLEARVTLYTIDPTSTFVGQGLVSTTDDLDDFESQSNGQPFEDEINFSTLAPATGGQAFFSRNDINNEIHDAVDQGGTYFTLTYSPTNISDSSAKYRQIRIYMKDPNLTATTRDGFYDSTGSDNALENVTKSAKETKKFLEAEMGNAALSTLEYNGLKMTISRGLGDIIRFGIDAGDLNWKPTKDGKFRAEITILDVSFSNKGKVLAHASDELFALVNTEVRNPDQKAVFQVHIPQPAGTSRIRVVARDVETGKLGTVEIKF